MLKKILAVLVMLYATMAMALAAVEVNKATDAQLDAVKGIGPATSKAITAERKKGDFKNWQDLIDRVKGIGDKKAATLSEQGLTVNGEAFKPAAAAKKDAKADKKDSKSAMKDEKKADAGKTAASGAKAAASAKK
jgi:competence protein ComEA